MQHTILTIGLLLVITLFTQTRQLFADDYSYQPYPVLLVHGFNSTPKASWGINTDKDKNDKHKISTAIHANKLNDGSYDEENRIAKDFAEQFSGISTWKRMLLHKTQTGFLPYEEAASYYDLNIPYGILLCLQQC